MITKLFLFFASAMFAVFAAKAQPVVIEGMAGNEYLFYQHLIAKRFSAETPFGIMHIANISNRYKTDPKKGGRPNEIMNQAYITTRLSKSFSILAGVFYADATGIRGSIGVQYARPFRNGLWVMVPRVDLAHRGSVEMMGMLEYQPVITGSVKLYTRLQVMSNYGAYHHNRSYQRLRLGAAIKGTQVGVGMNLDEYGRESRAEMNVGIFIRREVN